jgi:hypothetical protein
MGAIAITAVVTLVAGLLASPFLGPVGERFWRKRQIHYDIWPFTLTLPKDGLQLSHGAGVVTELTMLDIWISNTGSVALPPEMFSEPISVRLLSKTPCRVIEAKMAGTPVKGKKITIEGDRVVLPPVLLNRHEFIRLYLLVGGSPEAQLIVRVPDGSVFQREENVGRRRAFPPLVVPVAALASAVAILAYLLFNDGQGMPISYMHLLTGAVAGADVFVAWQFASQLRAWLSRMPSSP